MKPERRSFKSFLGETLAYRESDQIPSEVLNGMVERLREGDRTMIDPIIAGHYRLVTAIIAGSIRKKGKSADIEGAAFLSLVETVHNCCPHWDNGIWMPSRLYDNNITFYITTNVRYAIKDEYGSDHIIRVPPRTIRDKISKGEKFEDLVPSTDTEIGNDSLETLGQGLADKPRQALGAILPFHIPLSRNEFPSLEFNEALARCTQGEPMHEAIVKLRKEGLSYEEVGKKVGYSPQMISIIMPKIESKFNTFYP